jgi:PAS domain S-box-containing protein
MSPTLIHDVIDGIEVLICGLDVAGTIHVFNRSCEQLTGLSREHAIGASWLELFASGQRGEHVQALWSQAQEKALAGPFEALCRNKRNLRWHFSRDPSQRVQPVALWAVGIDITEEREAQVRARDLKQIVALGNLVSGLTHELRNPLNGALLQLALAGRMLARQHEGSSALADVVAQAAVEIRRISSILDDFLVFARPQPVHLERAALRGLVDQAVERNAARARAAATTIVVEPGGEALAEVDVGRLVSALSQLISNAIDASATTASREVRIRIATPKTTVVVEIEDRGVGIPPGADRIFEPFFSTKEGGTGLGLSIVERVATDHGGSIGYERRDGATVFRLEIPIVGGLEN